MHSVGMPGPMELVILLVSGVLCLGVPAAVIVLLVILLKRQGADQQSASANAALIEENRRLREELASLKGGKA
jgi:hypothetical protein